ncbi:hypothetical protein L1887_54661 [Cichorium endivia]|nr:hypothetical protein L1887_54661 [Cichorium endivia]
MRASLALPSTIAFASSHASPMPSLTESLTWAAALDRFLRGSQSVVPVPGGDDIAWQQFSGKNLSCRVVFSQPSPDASTKAGSREAGISSAASWKLSSDRQLRITVECGSTKTSDDQSEARSVAPSTCVERVEPVRRETASQPREAIVLEDVDLVSVNRTYYHTDHRLGAVETAHRGLVIGIRYLDQLDASKAVSSPGEASANAAERSTLAAPTPLPDHMRRWRATSPSSVDTSATHSSGEGDSPSTTATTDDGGDTTACASPEASSGSRGSTPGVERLSSKRAASSDAMTMSMIRSPKRRSQSRSPDFNALPDSQPDEEGNGSAAEATATSTTAEDEAQEGETVYEIIKRGRGRPRKDGLPNKSSIAVKRRVPTAREKRDAAQARKRERQLEKVGRARARVTGDETASSSPRPSPAEVCGFRELKI